MGKSSGGVRATGGLGGDRSGNAKRSDVKNTESLSKIKNAALRREIQQGISKYESRLGVRQRNVQLATMTDAVGVHVTAAGKSDGVYLNKRYFKNANVAQVVAMKQSAYKSGFLTKTNKPVQHTIVHELGHATWNSHLIGANAVAARRDIVAKYRDFKKEYSRGKLKSYGKYATANVNEFWAEATAKAVLGKADKYTRFVKATIKKYKL